MLLLLANHLQLGMLKLIFRNRTLVDFLMMFSKRKIVVRLYPASPIITKTVDCGAQKAYPKVLVLLNISSCNRKLIKLWYFILLPLQRKFIPLLWNSLFSFWEHSYGVLHIVILSDWEWYYVWYYIHPRVMILKLTRNWVLILFLWNTYVNDMTNCHIIKLLTLN